MARVRATLLGPWVDETSDLCAVIVGNRRLLESQQIAVDSAFEARLSQIEESGATTMLVAVDGRLLGAIGVRDVLRDESRSVIAELKLAGVKSFALLTGDRPQAARTVADALGVFDEVQSGLFPADKARWINEQQRQGRRVAMVGDGINDAPALAAADVGIALGGVGSDIAAEAGSLVLMGDPLQPLPGLLRLSHALVRNIRQSILIFAFGMNAVGILLSSFGFLSPVLAAVFHEAASLAVMLNATRLLGFERLQSSTAAGAWEQFSRVRRMAHASPVAQPLGVSANREPSCRAGRAGAGNCVRLAVVGRRLHSRQRAGVCHTLRSGRGRSARRSSLAAARAVRADLSRAGRQAAHRADRLSRV